jgi:hypothetical protein
MHNRNAGNQSTPPLSFSINSKQVFYTEIPAGENVAITIYDYTGKLVYSKSIVSNSNQFSIEKHINPGIYFIRFSSPGFNKIVKSTIN